MQSKWCKKAIASTTCVVIYLHIRLISTYDKSIGLFYFYAFSPKSVSEMETLSTYIFTNILKILLHIQKSLFIQLVQNPMSLYTYMYTPLFIEASVQIPRRNSINRFVLAFICMRFQFRLCNFIFIFAIKAPAMLSKICEILRCKTTIINKHVRVCMNASNNGQR